MSMTGGFTKQQQLFYDMNVLQNDRIGQTNSSFNSLKSRLWSQRMPNESVTLTSGEMLALKQITHGYQEPISHRSRQLGIVSESDSKKNHKLSSRKQSVSKKPDFITDRLFNTSH